MKIKPVLPEWGCSCNTESARNIDFADCKGTSRSGLSWSGVGSSLCSPGIRWPSSLRRRKSIKNGRVAKMMHFRFHYLVLSIYRGLDISHMMVCQIQVAIRCRNCNKKGEVHPGMWAAISPAETCARSLRADWTVAMDVRFLVSLVVHGYVRRNAVSIVCKSSNW